MRTIVLVLILVLTAVFAILNRGALMAPQPLNLGFATYPEVPLGLLLLVGGLVSSLLFYAWSGVSRLRAQADSARLLRDMETLRANLDHQEGSRFAQLQAHLDQRFQALGNGGPSSEVEASLTRHLAAVDARIDAMQRDVNVQLAQIDDYLKRRLR